MEKSVKKLKATTAIFFILAFICWVYCFWGFLTSRLTLTSDAISYYDHIKFYVESLARGVFPLWDPFFNDYGGNGNEFFLRRMGAYNPLYLVMTLFVKAGIPFREVYLWSMAGYYLLGMVGFYLLAMRIYKDQPACLTGTFILMFSSLGTRIFDSYMILVVVPLIWFFYFLTALVQGWKKWAFLGVTLSAAVLLTTYIPLYFLAFFIVGLISFVLIYPKEVFPIAVNGLRFVNKHKIMALACTVFLIIAFIPSILFLKTASQGQVVIPGRHGESEAKNQLVVDYKIVSDWGIPEDLFYSSYFSDMKRMRFAVLYFPIFALIILALGAFNRITRRSMFLFLCGFLLLCVVVPYFLPVHGVLYKYISFFKYFRNLHFFLWFMLIPLFALFVVDQLSGLLKGIKEKRVPLAIIYLVHGGGLILLLINRDTVISNYLVVALSYFVFRAYYYGKEFFSLGMTAVLSLCVLVQPLEVYGYLSRNEKPYQYPYAYDLYRPEFRFTKNVKLDPSQKKTVGYSVVYIAPYWYNYLNANSDKYTFIYLNHHRLIAYDHERVFNDFPSMMQGRWDQFEGFEGNSARLKVLAYDANRLMLETNFKEKKYLVYNDAYDPGWHAAINGKAVELQRANIAFKGIWVPSGLNRVEFIYGEPWQYGLNVSLLLGFSMVLIWLILERRREEHI